MTQTLQPNDAGKHAGDTTRSLIPRRPECDVVTRMTAPDVTGEIPLWPTGAELAVIARFVASQSQPLPPIRPSAPQPRPKSSGRHAMPAPMWTRWLIGIGALLVVEAAAVLSLLAVR